jgi:pSer/pThr/pTyr-binding forkhead associated (FHA) protein
MARLIVEYAGRRTEMLLNGRLSIGRTRGCGVVIDHPTVSRTHACIEPDGGGYVIADTGSRNGTIIGDEPITDRRPLREGEVIRIGSCRKRMRQTAPAPITMTIR